MDPASLLVLFGACILAWLGISFEHRRMRAAQRETLKAQADLRECEYWLELERIRGDHYRELFTQEAAERLAESDAQFAQFREDFADQAALYQYDCANLLILLGQSTASNLAAAVVIEHWKSYALAYEVFCEALSDKDADAAMNACMALHKGRQTLRELGQYDE